MQQALRQLGKACSDQDVRAFFDLHLPSGAGMDLVNFEEVVRACHGWERATRPLPPFDDCFSIGEGAPTTARTSASSRRLV